MNNGLRVIKVVARGVGGGGKACALRTFPRPLIVIDGIRAAFTGDNSLHPQRRTYHFPLLASTSEADIESGEVLKDALCQRYLWFTVAANGVILITTKKGTQGKGESNS